MNADYLEQLAASSDWLPGAPKIFNAFMLPLEQTRYILFGESPYPRQASANGYAFWDARVSNIWAQTGLSTEVNRATSLRNFIKMLLLANQDARESELSQSHIAQLDKSKYVQTLSELFLNMLNQGFLLLNASLVLSDRKVSTESLYWLPFIDIILKEVSQKRPTIKLLLFGKVSEQIRPFAEKYHLSFLTAEHPYNLSFISNPKIITFFNPLNLLKKVSV
jgi:uracil-DNA glycosylase